MVGIAGAVQLREACCQDRIPPCMWFVAQATSAQYMCAWKPNETRLVEANRRIVRAAVLSYKC